jgi:5-methylcytosine-specific restriction endonuclease McrA
MKASVLSFEERKTTYRTADGEERPTFTGIPDWLYAYKPQLANGRGWELLDTILHHQRMGQRNQPVAISLAQFAQETGHSIPTVRKALSDLALIGLLYEELDEPEQRDSGFRYAIQDHPGQGVVERDGQRMVSLLDGWHEVDSARVFRHTATRASNDTALPPRARISLQLLQHKLATLPPLRGHIPKHWAALRERIFVRDNYVCFYCGREDFYPLHCDHVIPPARGGQERNPNNLVTACGQCNGSKGALLPEEWLHDSISDRS